MIEWEDLVYATAERYGGQLPQPSTSQAIANIYAKAPSAVLRAIDRVAEEFETGAIRSPWGILKSRVERITPERQATAKVNDREKSIQHAEQLVRSIGHEMPWSEMRSELFGIKDETTPEYEWLVQFERETRDLPGREIYDGLLTAAILHTAEHGPEIVTSRPGILEPHDDQHLRQHMHDVWQGTQ